MGTIKEQLAAIAPALEQLWTQKEERVKEISDVQTQIHKICGEIAGNLNINESVGSVTFDESDLTLKKLDEYHAQLQELQKEKVDRFYNDFFFHFNTGLLMKYLLIDFLCSARAIG